MNFCVCRKFYVAVTWTCLHFWRWSGRFYNK